MITSNLTLENLIFSNTSFEEKALEVFRYQVRRNNVYRQYVKLIKRDINKVDTIDKIPFLPISLFKTHVIHTSPKKISLFFESSGTTGSIQSKHYVASLPLYERSMISGFEQFYGSAKKWCILGLLPSYLERSNSSLVYMVNKLIQLSEHPASGFFLHNHQQLKEILEENESKKQPTLLIGVTYALLDFAERFPFPLTNTIVMETGGMKGRKKELTRDEVHHQLTNAFSVSAIHAEYGMTELLSQAYSFGKGIFQCSSTLKILARAQDDPFEIITTINKPINGLANLIDLANLYSCSFIATDDVTILHPNGSFEIIGRADASDSRGCSLMLSE